MSDRTLSRLRAASAALGVALIALACGCSKGPARAQVSGTVTLDGVPVENGSIQFYPAGGAGQSAGGGVENGKYKLETSVGEMTVTINALKVTSKKKMYETADSPVIDVGVELIPAKYNTLSELKKTIAAGANDNVNFELTSK